MVHVGHDKLQSSLDTGFFCLCHDHHLVETGKYAIMILNVRPGVLTLVALVATGCQTASLEDAAPKSALVSTYDAGAAAPAGAVDVVADAATQAPSPDATATAQGSTVIRRNPGIVSPIPIEKTAPVENKEFVAVGANRTGQTPTFGRLPNTANTQLSEAEKSAAEAEMAALLRARAATPDARAQYEKRLKELQALASSHASDTQREIEN